VNTRNLAFGLLGTLAVGSAVWAQASTEVEHTVAALEQKWLESQKTNNADLLAPLLAENVVGTSDSGKVYVGKAALLGDAKSDKWTSAEYTDLKVTVFGNTAIATGGFNGKGVDSAGKPIDARIRFTDTWVKMPNGHWQCVASADSAVK